ncbi:MAG TPA: PH domain-containing protein [Pirellulaceae bacterium]|nr:PH domain-containing protein [Pirellulaceae bacterium]
MEHSTENDLPPPMDPPADQNGLVEPESQPIPLPGVDQVAAEQPSLPANLSAAGDSPVVGDDVWAGFYSLDPRCIAMERWVGILTAPLLAAVVAGGFFAMTRWWWKWDLAVVWFAVLFVVVTLILIWLSIVWPVWEFRRTRWKCDDIGIEIHRGIWWRRRMSVPFSRIQHVDVAQGPVQRRFGLAKFIVYTAGTQHSSVELPNIAWETAIWLRDRLMSEREVVDVV